MSGTTPKIDRRTMAQKQCSMCGEMKTDFTRGLKCRECYKQYCRDYYLSRRGPLKVRTTTPPDELKARHRATAYERRYNITEAQRDEMLAAQGGACLVCRDSDPGRAWCTDHDHGCCPERARSCGKCIRGILCFRCNTLLGHALDSTETLRSAIEYLEKWEARV